MTSPQSISAAPAPRTVSVVTPAASPSSPSHFQAIMGAILAAWQATEPVVITLLPPAAQIGVEAGTAFAPIVISTVAAIQEAKAAQK